LSHPDRDLQLRQGEDMLESSSAGRAAKYALGVLFAINLLNFFDRQLFGALSESIRLEFDLSDTRLGLLGTVFTLVYAVVGVPLGRISDTWPRNRLIAISTALWSLLTAATGAAHSYLQVFISRLGVGVGEAACAPVGQSLVSDLFPPQQRARAMGVFMLGLPAGVFLAYISAGAIGAALGWRAVFYFACIPGLLLACLAAVIREPGRGASEPARLPTAGGAAVGSPYAAVLRLPTMWWIILSGIFHNFNMYAINSFNTPFLLRFHAMSLRQASVVSAISIGAVGAVGLLVGGYLADRMGARRRNLRLVLSAVSMLAAAPCVFLALHQPAGAIAPYVTWMTLATIMMYVYYATVYTALQDLIEPRLRGTAVAVYFCAMYLLGASIGPVGTGMLSDHFARRAMVEAGASSVTESFKAIGLHEAMYAIPISVFMAAVVLFAASRTMEGDVRRQRLRAGQSALVASAAST
jgi:MFS family permease